MKILNNPRGVAWVTVVIGILIAIRLLAAYDWDPTVFTAFGEDANETIYAQEKLGREVVTRPRQGHDGKFFFVQSNDPWILDPDENASVLKRPIYRSQRMLFPVIAGGGGLFTPEVIVWSLLVVNLVALGVGSWAVARIAMLHGGPAWVGLGFGLNIGIMFELLIDGAGIVAFALASLGALALERKRPGPAALLFVTAVLTREVMILFVGFIWLVWWLRRKERPWRIVVPSVLAILGWAIYVRLQLGADVSKLEIKEITVIPFSGLVEALSTGLARPLDLAVMFLMLGFMGVVAYRSLQSEIMLTWGALGFAVLAPFLTVFVWQKYFDISRALAPLTTAFLLEVIVSRAQRETTKTAT